AIFTNDEALAARLRMIANHGQKERYYHELVGCNSRLDAIQAAVLNIKLKELDNYLDARIRAADYYDAAFKEQGKISVPYRAPWCRHVFHQYTLVLEGVDRNALHEWLASQGVPSMIYYPVPAHRQQMLAAFGGGDFQLPVTDWLTERVISLPMHTELEKDQMDYIIAKVLEYINK